MIIIKTSVRKYGWKLTFNHADVIGTIPDGQGDGFLVLLHQIHHLSLLNRSHSGGGGEKKRRGGGGNEGGRGK